MLGEARASAWSKARAVADGLLRTAADILVIADADVWCDDLGEAIEAVRRGAPWAIPHSDVHRLSPSATAAALRGAPLNTVGPLTQPPYRGYEGGGLVVLRRDLYERAPLDPRYLGWGQEDESWALALRTLAGRPWRGTAPLYHLWHPPQPRESRRWGSPAARHLYHQYRRAAGDPDTMRALLGEMRGGARGVA